jgi:hypothetical protein
MKAKKKKIKLDFTGEVDRDDILIGSHGNTDIKIKGNFKLSGIIYCPKYTVTLDINGDGRISFRGKCHRVVIRSMKGNCMLDLTDLTYKELHCQSLKGKANVMAGNARAITPAILADEAILHVHEYQLIFNPVTAGNSKILTTTSAGGGRVFNLKNYCCRYRAGMPCPCPVDYRYWAFSCFAASSTVFFRWRVCW